MGHPGALACSKTLNKPSTCFLQRHLSYSYPCRRILCRHIHIEDFTTPPNNKVSFEDLPISRFSTAPLFLEAQRQLEREQGLRLSRASWLSCTVSCGGGNGGTVHFQHRLRMLSSKKSPLADWDLQILRILGRGSKILSFWSFPVLGTCSSHFGYQVLRRVELWFASICSIFLWGTKPRISWPDSRLSLSRILATSNSKDGGGLFEKGRRRAVQQMWPRSRWSLRSRAMPWSVKWMGSGWGPGNFRIYSLW